jgi:hypothetical protein
MTVMEGLAKLKTSGMDPTMAEAVMSVIEDNTVTRDHLDAKLEAMEKRLIIWGVSMAGSIVVLTTILVTAVERLTR